MRLVIALLPGLAVGLLLAGCDRQKAAEPQARAAANEATAAAAPAAGESYPTGVLDRSHAGTPAPDVAFEDPQGRPTSFAAFRGRPLLVNLWATWCPPCRMEMPSMEALSKKFAAEDFVMLAVSEDDGGAPVVKKFVDEMKLTFPILTSYIGYLGEIATPPPRLA